MTLALPACQIPLRQHLAFFHRGLAERIDAEQMRGDHCFEKEMHHQRAEAGRIKPREMDRAHRAAVLRQSLGGGRDRKSTRLNSSHDQISYAVFCLKKKNKR